MNLNFYQFDKKLQEIGFGPGGMPEFPEKISTRKSQSSLEKLLPKVPDFKQPKKELQPTGPSEPEEKQYDPREEDAYADVVKALQDMLDVLDRNRGDANEIERHLARIALNTHAYLDILER